MQLRVVVASTLVACSIGLPASGQSSEKIVVRGTGAISGRAIDQQTGRALADVTVSILDIDRRFGSTGLVPGDGRMRTLVGPKRLQDAQTTTGSDGRYSFHELRVARYVVVASRPGFVQQPQGPADATLISEGIVQVGAGERVEDVNFVLARAAVVGGQVFDQYGRPLADARVSVAALPESMRGGAPSSVEADDRGEYRFDDLPAGNYRFAATVLPERLSKEDQSFVLPQFQRTYFPGVTTHSESGVISLGPGDKVSGINIPITFAELLTVSGMVLRGSSLAGGRVDAFVTPSPGASIRRFGVREDDSFSIGGLKPGRYLLWVRAEAADGFEVAWQALDLADDQPGVQLPMSPSGRISGRVVTGDGSPLPIEGLRVAAVLHDGKHDIDPIARDQVEIEADGSFVLDGLFGDRTMRVIGLPSGWMLAGAQLGNQGATTLTIGPGDRLENLLLVITRR